MHLLCAKHSLKYLHIFYLILSSRPSCKVGAIGSGFMSEDTEALRDNFPRSHTNKYVSIVLSKMVIHNSWSYSLDNSISKCLTYSPVSHYILTMFSLKCKHKSDLHFCLSPTCVIIFKVLYLHLLLFLKFLILLICPSAVETINDLWIQQGKCSYSAHHSRLPLLNLRIIWTQ